jgi:hypothetical protein
MTSIVSGYICTSSCDVDAARRGRDPRHPNDEPSVARERALREGRVVGSAFEIDAGLKFIQASAAGSALQFEQQPANSPSALGQNLDRIV